VTDEAGLTTRYEYMPGGKLRAVIYPDNTKETYSYDEGGNVKSATGRTGQTATYDYDSLNRVIKVTDSSGTSRSCTYDAVSNLTSMTDAGGNTTMYEYTLTGKLSKVTDALGNIALYTYDESDRLIEVHQGESNSRVVRYERNIMGQVESVTDAMGNKESYCYDVRGQLVEKLDKDGYLTKYGYTQRGDVSHIAYADGSEVTLSYDPLRQLKEVEDRLGITKIETDRQGRTSKVTNHQGLEVSYLCNAFGQKTGIVYPDGTKVSYAYDELLRLKEVCDGINTTQYRYDALSRLSEKMFTDGTTTKYGYDDSGRLHELSHQNADGILDSYRYKYDSLGNKTEVGKERRGLPDESGVYSYAYDALSRLLEVQKDGNPLRSYEYDSFGNRTGMTDGETHTLYTYNSLGQLIATADTVGNEQSYTYDKRGNLTQVHKDGALINEYTFGAINRLEYAINHETAQAAAYRYNGMGYRVGQSMGAFGVNPTRHIDYVLDFTRHYNNLLQRSGDNGTTAYVWDGGLLSSVSAAGASHYMLDDLGSPVRFGKEAYDYDEFGNMLGEAASSQPFGFTGYMHDAVANSYFAQAREYLPSIGRFMSRDIVKGSIQAPLTMNPYTYCRNRPLDFVDLDGRVVLPSVPTWVIRIGMKAGQAVGEAAVDVAKSVSAGVSLVAAVAQGIADDIRHLDFGNTNENVVINAFNHVPPNPSIPNDPGDPRERLLSAYKGQLVVNTGLLVPGFIDMLTSVDSTFSLNLDMLEIERQLGRSASIGPFILLSKGGRNSDTIKHEGRHFSELQHLGFWRHIIGIGMPSARSSVSGLDYFKQPWEIIADILGGVNRPDRDNAGLSIYRMTDILRGLKYFDYVNTVRITGPFSLGTFMGTAWGTNVYNTPMLGDITKKQ